MNGEMSTPDLDDLQQLDEPEGVINVPVRVTEIGPVEVHLLPARHAVMRNVVVTDVVQEIVGRDLRRKSITVWATVLTGLTGGHLYLGTNKSEVEAGTAARLPAPQDNLIETEPMQLVMTHSEPLWARRTGNENISLSFIAEYWAD